LSGAASDGTGVGVAVWGAITVVAEVGSGACAKTAFGCCGGVGKPRPTRMATLMIPRTAAGEVNHKKRLFMVSLHESGSAKSERSFAVSMVL